MTRHVESPRVPSPSIFFSEGFRPFFLAAAVWSATAIAVWAGLLTTGATLPSRFDPRSWHIHEMLFGFVMASVAGFLLTAVANWTKRIPVHGATLQALVSLWLLGRLTCLISAALPVALTIMLDLSFSITLAIVVARELIAAHHLRNLLLLGPLALLGAANVCMHLEAAGIALPAELGWRLAVAGIVILISIVGGRIIPAFTRNWLTAHHAANLPPNPGNLDRMALGTLHAGVMIWAFLPHSYAAGTLLLAGAAVNGLRLGRWRGLDTLDEPLLFVLHIGYAWLVAGTAFLSLAAYRPAMPESAAIHALSTGAMGILILAVMTRATRGHTGRALVANRSTTAIYILGNLAALARVSASLLLQWHWLLIAVSASLWILAFGLFAATYGTMMLRRRVDTTALTPHTGENA